MKDRKTLEEYQREKLADKSEDSNFIDLGKNDLSENAKLAFRANGISDKDAPTLYGITPGRTLGEMWSDKCEIVHTGKDDSDDSIFTARVMDALGITAQKEYKHILVRNKSMPFIAAELRYACPEKGYFAKVVSQTPLRHSMAGNDDLDVRAGKIPEATWIEIQHAMIAAGFVKAYFVSTVDGTQSTIVPVMLDDCFRSNHVAECVVFMDYVRRGILPPGATMPEDEAPELDPAWDKATALEKEFEATAAKQAETELKFKAILAEEKYGVQSLGVGVGYLISFHCASKADVVDAAERFEYMGMFRQIMGETFRNGMVDGIKTYRREIAKLGGMYGKALTIADRLMKVLNEHVLTEKTK